MDEARETVKHLAAFKQTRDAAVHADTGDLEHHLGEFVREVARNPLCQRVLAALPQYDAEAWWRDQTSGPNARRATLVFPEDPDEKLVVLWDLVSSMGSGSSKTIDARSFGYQFRARDAKDATAKAISLVIRPFAAEMSDRLREQATLASPHLRELAGVPLAAIPGENELRIFLSHRTSDKELVRPYDALLRELGYQPWLDEHDMPAGTTLHRAIADGMDNACAVVFFVTKNFEDERWLAREVDHAVHRKVERGEKFSIVTLVFGGAEVPRALHDYVWINVTSDIDAARQIIRALPIELGAARWRSRIYRR